MRWLILLGCSFFTFSLNAQYISNQFQTDISGTIEVDNEGNYYLSGYDWLVDNPSGVVAKYDSTGTLLWKSKWGDEESVVDDIILTTDNRLFGINVGLRIHERIFELNTQTGDTLWTFPIESACEETNGNRNVYSNIWLDSNHIVALVYNRMNPDDRKALYVLTDEGQFVSKSYSYGIYGSPSLDLGRTDFYPMPIQVSEDYTVVYRYHGNHDTVLPLDSSVYPLFEAQPYGTIALKFYRAPDYSTRNSLRLYNNDSNLVYDVDLIRDTSVLDGLLVNSTVVLGSNLLVGCSIGQVGQIGADTYHALYKIETGEFLWDTIMDQETSLLDVKNLGYRNGFLYSVGAYNTYINVCRYNLPFINEITSVDDLVHTEESFTVYPNPAHDFLNINLQSKSNISLYDISGNLVLFRENQVSVTQLDISNLSSGTYIINVQNRQLNEYSKIIIR